MSKIIDGRKVASELKEEMKAKIEKLKKEGKGIPGLAVVILGENPASRIYVNSKAKNCKNLGIYFKEHALPIETTEKELLNLIKVLNTKDEIDGILVQLPLPKHIDENKIIEAINPHKDVDGFHPLNLGSLMAKRAMFKPCTPYGIMELIKRYHIDLEGKDVVIIGRSSIVGKPLSIMMSNKDATVTLCHSKTKDIFEKTKKADLIVVAVGIKNFLKEEMIKEGCIVIDVGINRTSEGKLCGDVDYKNVFKKASLITPVPGGVGPMTTVMLLESTVDSRIYKTK